ncbi:unnamed protein product [Ambrosiozyma monospora]|uniref:Unnamed protein product n=1 Tax=Ambrosiozyma monospora TaxID=43982 RepID=A0ACB5TYJ4_AMBMO|nr:unnamed protein product [Ambrosiozyma monospora]
MISANVPILVEDMSFKGRMRITLTLGQVFPHIKIVSISFLEPPAIDYALKPVGGNTLGLDVMSFIPGLKSLVNTIINSQLGPMLYAPNHLDINVEEIIEGMTPQALGCLAVKIRGVEYKKRADINPFIEYYLQNDSTKKYRTDIKTQTNAAVFNEDNKILVSNLAQNLVLELFDFHDGEPDSLGETTFELNDLLQSNSREFIEGKITKNNKTIGKIVYDLVWIPVLEGETDSKGVKGPAPESEIGVFDYTLLSARGLDRSQSLFDKLSTFAEVYVDGEKVNTSRTVKQSNHPEYTLRSEKLIMSNCFIE